jgi:hypothetical protein
MEGVRFHSFWRRSVSKFNFNVNTREVEIILVNGDRVLEGDKVFPTAMNQLIGWYTQLVPGALHNWVHFHMPDAISDIVAYFHADMRNSVLGHLLAPHVRFTAMINSLGVFRQEATDNKPDEPGCCGTYKKPWGGIRTTGEEFRMGVIENTAHNYEDMVKFCQKCPDFDISIPYFFFLRSHYEVIKKFVTAVAPYIDPKDYGWLVSKLKTYNCNIERVPMIDFLTAFIWQVGIVHVTDHMSFTVQSLEYCFNQPSEDIYVPFSVSDVNVWDRWRTRNEFNMFFGYHPNPSVKHHMADVENYMFSTFDKIPECEAAAQQFKQDILAMDAALREARIHIYPVWGMPQSVCF